MLTLSKLTRSKHEKDLRLNTEKMKNKAEKYSSELLANVLDEISPAEQGKIDKRMFLCSEIITYFYKLKIEFSICKK